MESEAKEVGQPAAQVRWVATLGGLRGRLRGVKRPSQWGPTVVAALLALAVLGELFPSWARKGGDFREPRFLVARRALGVGLPVTFADLGIASLGDRAPQKAITDQELHLLGQATLARSLGAGEPLTWDALQSAPASLGLRVPKGRRTYALEAEPHPAVFVRDRVDLWPGGKRGAEGGPLVEGAAVLSVRREGDAQRVVLAVKPHDIGVLEKAREQGRLVLSLRNPQETGSLPRLRARGMRRAEVWVEQP